MVKVLVVDDSSLTRAILIKTLMEAGHSVVSAENGRAGFEVFTVERPELILTDLMMPEMDGIELSKLIRTKDNKVPIILISAEFNKEIKVRSERAGINDYLFKNFEKKDLLRKVETLLERR